MARIRSVKPEFWVDRSFVRKVPNRDARMLYMALWNLADEHARLMGDPAYIKGQAFPYAEDDDLTPKVIDALLDMLVLAERVVRYEVDGDPYLFLPRLAKHQRLESAKVPSRLPPPPDPDDPAPRPDKSARNSDESAPIAVSPSEPTNGQVGTPSEARADKSARDLDESARDADQSALLYVAGGREQVAGFAAPAPTSPAQLALISGLAADEPPPHERGTPIDEEKPATAQTLIDGWLKQCKKRPPDTVIGHLGRLIKSMLQQDIDPDDIAAGLTSWHRKGLHPSTLPSEVNAVMNAQRSGPPDRHSAANDLGGDEHMARFLARQAARRAQ